MVDEIKPFYIYKEGPKAPIEPFAIFKTRQDNDPFKIYKETSPENIEVAAEWRIIDIYTFPGTSASTAWTTAAGSYVGASRVITTEAVRVRIIPLSGYWYDGFHYRGMMDYETKDSAGHVGYDWTGTFFGWAVPGNAASYWLTVSFETDIGTDKVFAWGGYDTTGGADNSGALIFALYGEFPRA